MKYIIALAILLSSLGVYAQSSEVVKNGIKTEAAKLMPTAQLTPRIAFYSLPQADSLKVANVVALEITVQEFYLDIPEAGGKVRANMPTKYYFTDETNKTILLDENRILAIYPCNYCK